MRGTTGFHAYCVSALSLSCAIRPNRKEIPMLPITQQIRKRQRDEDHQPPPPRLAQPMPGSSPHSPRRHAVRPTMPPSAAPLGEAYQQPSPSRVLDTPSPRLLRSESPSLTRLRSNLDLEPLALPPAFATAGEPSTHGALPATGQGPLEPLTVCRLPRREARVDVGIETYCEHAGLVGPDDGLITLGRGDPFSGLVAANIHEHLLLAMVGPPSPAPAADGLGVGAPNMIGMMLLDPVSEDHRDEAQAAVATFRDEAGPPEKVYVGVAVDEFSAYVEAVMDHHSPDVLLAAFGVSAQPPQELDAGTRSTWLLDQLVDAHVARAETLASRLGGECVALPNGAAFLAPSGELDPLEDEPRLVATAAEVAPEIAREVSLPVRADRPATQDTGSMPAMPVEPRASALGAGTITTGPAAAARPQPIDTRLDGMPGLGIGPKLPVTGLAQGAAVVIAWPGGASLHHGTDFELARRLVEDSARGSTQSVGEGGLRLRLLLDQAPLERRLRERHAAITQQHGPVVGLARFMRECVGGQAGVSLSREAIAALEELPARLQADAVIQAARYHEALARAHEAYALGLPLTDVTGRNLALSAQGALVPARETATLARL